MEYIIVPLRTRPKGWHESHRSAIKKIMGPILMAIAMLIDVYTWELYSFFMLPHTLTLERICNEMRLAEKVDRPVSPSYKGDPLQDQNAWQRRPPQGRRILCCLWLPGGQVLLVSVQTPAGANRLHVRHQAGSGFNRLWPFIIFSLLFGLLDKNLWNHSLDFEVWANQIL